jgi:hypothetical protein
LNGIRIRDKGTNCECYQKNNHNDPETIHRVETNSTCL